MLGNVADLSADISSLEKYLPCEIQKNPLNRVLLNILYWELSLNAS